MNINELKKKWSKEKEEYKRQEIGSGVQIFVKDVLQSEDIFSLKKGLKSTALEKRNYEFLEEEATKANRRADIIVYISSNIIVPVEIEKYENIEIGTKQIIAYKTDLEQPYGILTDGCTWRFYTNNIYREFNLKQIFDETELFLEFWNEYIKPESYYRLFFETTGQSQVIIPVEKARQLFFEDITKLIKSFKNKLQLEGYLNNVTESKYKEKMAVELTYAYIIQFILYKTLVDNEFDSFREEFDEIVKLIHTNLKQKRYKDILGIISKISATISSNIYKPFSEEQKFINDKLLQIYQDVTDKLSDVSPWLDIFVFIKKYNFANIENEIFGYIYENYLKELYEESKKGQYFTDPDIVNFMLKEIGYTPDNIRNRYKSSKHSISLIDPACGSGTFLYSAVNQINKAFGDSNIDMLKEVADITNNNIFGLDIEEFPVYLAEMSIVMRILPLIVNENYNNPLDKKIKVFLTKDSIAEFMNVGNVGAQITLDLFEKLQLGYKSYVREEADLEEMKKSLELDNNMLRRRFDYVIGNPPYVGYNQASKQGHLIIKLIQEKNVQMSNIYGVNLNTVPGRIKAYAPKPNLYAFFIALGVHLLKEEGKLCYIIPQTILTAGDLDVIRYYLATEVSIEKIITFNGPMFVGRGLRQNKPVYTSSLIIVLSRKKPNSNHKVVIVNYQNTTDDVETVIKNIEQEINIISKEILQRKLLNNVANWNFIKHDKATIDCVDLYGQNNNVDEYRLPEKSIDKYNSVFYFDKGLVFPKDEIVLDSEVQSNEFYYLTKAEKDKYKLTLSSQVVPKSALSYPSGSQGIEVYCRAYKIVWSYMNPRRFYFSDNNIMISFNWILITGDNKNEMLYMLSLLNSRVNWFILTSYLKTENEKDLLVGIKTIKEFIRIPEITDKNIHIKEEIVNRTEEMLAEEDKKLLDVVDFSSVMLQKLDEITVVNDELILRKDELVKKLNINKSRDLVLKALDNQYNKCLDKYIGADNTKISLKELKELPIINYTQQGMLKKYIDDLVFALYFNIVLDEVSLDNADAIKHKCSQNIYYDLIEERTNMVANVE